MDVWVVKVPVRAADRSNPVSFKRTPRWLRDWLDRMLVQSSLYLQRNYLPMIIDITLHTNKKP